MYVYIVRCSDGTLYTGIAKDVAARVLAHNQFKSGARYTKARRPVTLVHSESCGSRSEALKREYAIKRMSRRQKLKLVAG